MARYQSFDTHINRPETTARDLGHILFITLRFWVLIISVQLSLVQTFQTAILTMDSFRTPHESVQIVAM